MEIKSNVLYRTEFASWPPNKDCELCGNLKLDYELEKTHITKWSYCPECYSLVCVYFLPENSPPLLQRVPAGWKPKWEIEAELKQQIKEAELKADDFTELLRQELTKKESCATRAND
jgi:hypothetical protein